MPKVQKNGKHYLQDRIHDHSVIVHFMMTPGKLLESEKNLLYKWHQSISDKSEENASHPATNSA